MDRNFDSSKRSINIENIKSSIPVGYTGYRWATLIDPLWNAFSLAEVLYLHSTQVISVPSFDAPFLKPL